MTPRALDLFCGAGGVSRGLQLAGFHVTGVDVKPQPRYCGDAFHQADAMTFRLEGFDFIWASPPCQHFTKYKNCRRDLPQRYPDLIDPVRSRLSATGIPYVIENVVGSPLGRAIILCGSMFGLDIQRHRVFESSMLLLQPECNHSHWPMTPRFPGGRSRERGHARVLCRRTIEVGRWNIPLTVQRDAMEIDWMELEELSESIPPAYSQYIGEQMMPHVLARMKERAA